MKLVLISDRLPVSVSEEDGQPRFTDSPGGFAPGLRGYLDSPRAAPPSRHVWVGWPGGPVRPELRAEVTRRWGDVIERYGYG